MQYTKNDLYIRNLPRDITKEILLAHFAGKGFPLCFSWLIRTHKSGEPLQRPFSTAVLKEPTDQEKCIAALNGTELHGRKIFVEPYRDFPAMQPKLQEQSKPSAEAFQHQEKRNKRVSFKSPVHPTWAAHVAGETESDVQQ